MWVAKVSGRNVPRHIGPGIVVGVNLVLDAKGLDVGDVVYLYIWVDKLIRLRGCVTWWRSGHDCVAPCLETG